MVRQTLHAIVAVLSWFVFVYYWTVVVGRPMNPDTKTALVVLSAITILTALYLTLWIHHNIRIHRRVRHRRKHRRDARDPEQDYLGRRMIMENLQVLRRSNYIEVGVIRDWVSGVAVEQKIFRSVDRVKHGND